MLVRRSTLEAERARHARELLGEREAWAAAAAAERAESRELIAQLIAELGASARPFAAPVVQGEPFTSQDEEIASEQAQIAARIEQELSARGIDVHEPLVAS